MTRFLVNVDIQIEAENADEAEHMIFSVLKSKAVNVNCEKTVDLDEEAKD